MAAAPRSPAGSRTPVCGHRFDRSSSTESSPPREFARFRAERKGARNARDRQPSRPRRRQGAPDRAQRRPTDPLPLHCWTKLRHRPACHGDRDRLTRFCPAQHLADVIAQFLLGNCRHKGDGSRTATMSAAHARQAPALSGVDFCRTVVARGIAFQTQLSLGVHSVLPTQPAQRWSTPK